MMSALALAFAMSLAISLALTPAIRDFALRRQLVDAADSSRKVHSRRIPRLGGIAMLFAFFAAIPVPLLLDRSLRQEFASRAPELGMLACGAAALGMLGAIDDLRGVAARWKLLVQCAVSVVAFVAGIRATAISVPGLGTLQLGMLALPVTVLWIVGVVNAMNLIDGLDGLAGGISLIALGSGVVLSMATGNMMTAAVLSTGAGAVLGFLRYNFHPATIFMGDTGSMFLGYLLAISAIALPGDAPRVAPGVSAAMLAVPLADTAVAVARRIVRGRSVFSADREHIHHLLLDSGMPHRRVVLLLCGVSATFCSIALAAAFGGDRIAAALALAVFCGLALELRRLGLLRLRSGREILEQRQRNRARRAAVRTIASRMRHAATLYEVLEMLEPIRSVLSASRAVASVSAAGLRRDFASARGAEGAVFAARFPIGTPSLGNVEVHWSDGRRRIDRDDEIAIEHICEHVERAVRRIRPRAV